MPGPLELSFQVSSADAPGGSYRMAAWMWTPETPPAPGAGVSLVVCYHGGGYTRSYYHLEVPGRDGYSMAEHLSAAGHTVVAFDQPGAGASSRPDDGTALTVDAVVAADDAMCRQLVRSLLDGTLHEAVPPAPEVTTTGVGHSLGGSLLTVQQARYRTFDRIAAFGATNLPRPWGGEFSFEITAGYGTFNRAALRHGFYWDDVPADVIAADEAEGVDMAVGLVPAPDVAAAEAASIDVPVLLSFGERDTSPDPRAEVRAFPGSNDITLLVVEGSGHCSNFSSNRRMLWDRLCGWIAATTPAPAGAGAASRAPA